MDNQELIQVLEESHHWGFLGPGPVLPHIVSAEAFAQALPRANDSRDLSLIDLGSGGGLPGLPLFVWRTDLSGVLVDARTKRTKFLSRSVETLHLSPRVQVVTGRIEDLYETLGTFDVATARSFGPPSATVEIASHLLNPAGLVLVSEPPDGRLWAADGLAHLGLTQVSAPGSHIAVFRQTGKSAPRRRWKAMVTRPAVLVS